MSISKRETEQFTVNIVCPKCAAVGVAVWENDNGQRSLVSLSNGFYERLSKKAPYPIELVCTQCGRVQKED